MLSASFLFLVTVAGLACQRVNAGPLTTQLTLNGKSDVGIEKYAYVKKDVPDVTFDFNKGDVNEYKGLTNNKDTTLFTITVQAFVIEVSVECTDNDVKFFFKGQGPVDPKHIAFNQTHYIVKNDGDTDTPYTTSPSYTWTKEPPPREGMYFMIRLDGKVPKNFSLAGDGSVPEYKKDEVSDDLPETTLPAIRLSGGSASLNVSFFAWIVVLQSLAMMLIE